MFFFLFFTPSVIIFFLFVVFQIELPTWCHLRVNVYEFRNLCSHAEKKKKKKDEKDKFMQIYVNDFYRKRKMLTEIYANLKVELSSSVIKCCYIFASKVSISWLCFFLFFSFILFIFYFIFCADYCSFWFSSIFSIFIFCYCCCCFIDMWLNDLSFGDFLTI